MRERPLPVIPSLTNLLLLWTELNISLKKHLFKSVMFSYCEENKDFEVPSSFLWRPSNHCPPPTLGTTSVYFPTHMLLIQESNCRPHLGHLYNTSSGCLFFSFPLFSVWPWSATGEWLMTEAKHAELQVRGKKKSLDVQQQQANIYLNTVKTQTATDQLELLHRIWNTTVICGNTELFICIFFFIFLLPQSSGRGSAAPPPTLPPLDSSPVSHSNQLHSVWCEYLT